MPGNQGGGAGAGRQLPGWAGQTERGGQAALPNSPAIKSRSPPASLPARFHSSGKCTSHFGFSLVVRNLCNDGSIGTGPLLGHTGLAETIPEQPGVPPVITRMLVLLVPPPLRHFLLSPVVPVLSRSLPPPVIPAQAGIHRLEPSTSGMPAERVGFEIVSKSGGLTRFSWTGASWSSATGESRTGACGRLEIFTVR